MRDKCCPKMQSGRRRHHSPMDCIPAICFEKFWPEICDELHKLAVLHRKKITRRKRVLDLAEPKWCCKAQQLATCQNDMCQTCCKRKKWLRKYFGQTPNSCKRKICEDLTDEWHLTPCMEYSQPSERIIDLAQPKQAWPNIHYKDPSIIKRSALTYEASDRILRLYGVPTEYELCLERRKKAVKLLHAKKIKYKQEGYQIPWRLKKLAKPKVRKDTHYREPTIKRKTLLYTPSDRIKEMARPRNQDNYCAECYPEGSPAAFIRTISERLIELSKPRIYAEKDESRDPNQIKREALTYKPTERIKAMAEPMKKKSSVHIRRNPFSVRKSAFKGKLTKRLEQLAQPRKKFFNSTAYSDSDDKPMQGSEAFSSESEVAASDDITLEEQASTAMDGSTPRQVGGSNTPNTRQKRVSKFMQKVDHFVQTKHPKKADSLSHDDTAVYQSYPEPFMSGHFHQNYWCNWVDHDPCQSGAYIPSLVRSYSYDAVAQGSIATNSSEANAAIDQMSLQQGVNMGYKVGSIDTRTASVQTPQVPSVSGTQNPISIYKEADCVGTGIAITQNPPNLETHIYNNVSCAVEKKNPQMMINIPRNANGPNSVEEEPSEMQINILRDIGGVNSFNSVGTGPSQMQLHVLRDIGEDAYFRSVYQEPIQAQVQTFSTISRIYSYNSQNASVPNQRH